MIAEQAAKLTAILDELERRPGGGDVNRVPIGSFSCPAVHTAALLGRVDLASRVLIFDPDPNELDMFGHTALDRINEGGGHGDVDEMMNFLLSIGGTYNR